MKEYKLPRIIQAAANAKLQAGGTKYEAHRIVSGWLESYSSNLDAEHAKACRANVRNRLRKCKEVYVEEQRLKALEKPPISADDWDMPISAPHWQCQSCGHKDMKKPLPASREVYYADPKPAECSRCNSLDLTPQGF